MPLLLKCCRGTYGDFLKLMGTLNFHDPKSTSSGPKVLPPELVSRVLAYVTVEPVQMAQVRPTGCSTHDGAHPLTESLTESESTWWLAQPGSMPRGKGRQYVQYSLTETATLCRLRRVSVKIPPLPVGPLSVREFHLETLDAGREWIRISRSYRVENVEGWQTFDLLDGGCDVHLVRVMCTRNQVALYNDDDDDDDDDDDSEDRSSLWINNMHRFASVGFYSIRFE